MTYFEWNVYKDRFCIEAAPGKGKIIEVSQNGIPVHAMMYLGHNLIFHRPNYLASEALSFEGISSIATEWNEDTDCFLYGKGCKSINIRHLDCDPNQEFTHVDQLDEIERIIYRAIEANIRLAPSREQLFSELSKIQESYSEDELIVQKTESLKEQLRYIKSSFETQRYHNY